MIKVPFFSAGLAKRDNANAFPARGVAHHTDIIIQRANSYDAGLAILGPERTLRAWESGQSTPDMTARSFLAMIERDPKSVAAIYAAALEKNKEDAAAA
jgi:hypothetical protein